MPASTWSTTDKTASLTLSGSNLIATAGATNQGVRGKDPKRTGKYYLEYTSTTGQGSGLAIIGFGSGNTAFAGVSTAASVLFDNTASGSIQGYNSAAAQVLSSGVGFAITTGTVVCYAIDLDSQLIWIRSGAAGNWNNSSSNNPATGVGGVNFQAVGLGQGIDCFPFYFAQSSGASITANFGGSAFTGTVPSGFTSGWDDTVSVVTNMIATQIAIEEWASVANAPAVTSQIYVMVMA